MSSLYGVSDDQLGGLVYLACEAGPGKPRDVLRHLEMKDVLTADGLKLVWQLLDEEYIREPYVRSDEALTRYNRCRRKPGQAMEEFLRELKLARRMLEKEDPEMRMSETSYANHMLRNGGLNKSEQRQVLGAAQAQWDPKKIEDALRLMFRDAHGDDRRRMKETRGTTWRPNFNSSAQKSGHRKKGGGRGYRHGAHYEEAITEPEEEEESPGDQEEQEEAWEDENQEDYLEIPGEEDVPDLESDDLSEADPEELMEAYFQGVRAHRRLKRIGFKGKGKGRGKSSGKG